MWLFSSVKYSIRINLENILISEDDRPKILHVVCFHLFEIARIGKMKIFIFLKDLFNADCDSFVYVYSGTHIHIYVHARFYLTFSSGKN